MGYILRQCGLVAMQFGGKLVGYILRQCSLVGGFFKLLAYYMNSNRRNDSFLKEIIVRIKELELNSAPVHTLVALHRHLCSLAPLCRLNWESHGGGAKAAHDATHISEIDNEVAFKEFPGSLIEDSIEADVENEVRFCTIKPDSVDHGGPVSIKHL